MKQKFIYSALKGYDQRSRRGKMTIKSKDEVVREFISEFGVTYRIWFKNDYRNRTHKRQCIDREALCTEEMVLMKEFG